MHVLITNDDGVNAPGLLALCDALKDHCEMLVVAPDRERSACGHGITIKEPLRAYELEGHVVKTFALTGKPADCIKIGVRELMEDPPDLVLSGINLGANTGVNVVYSGTVAGAMEGAILGVPSIALSLTTYKDPDFSVPALLARMIVCMAQQDQLGLQGKMLNINVPNVSAELIEDIVVTHQGPSRFVEAFDKRLDPDGRPYYWLTGEKPTLEGVPQSDESAVANHCVSVTPLTYDFTDYRCVPGSQEPFALNTHLTAFMDSLKDAFKSQR